MALKQRGGLYAPEEISVSSRQEGDGVLFQIPTQVPEAIEWIFGIPQIVTCPALSQDRPHVVLV
jgi:hypothetical protein